MGHQVWVCNTCSALILTIQHGHVALNPTLLYYQSDRLWTSYSTQRRHRTKKCWMCFGLPTIPRRKTARAMILELNIVSLFTILTISESFISFLNNCVWSVEAWKFSSDKLWFMCSWFSVSFFFRLLTWMFLGRFDVDQVQQFIITTMNKGNLQKLPVIILTKFSKIMAVVHALRRLNPLLNTLLLSSIVSLQIQSLGFLMYTCTCVLYYLEWRKCGLCLTCAYFGAFFFGFYLFVSPFVPHALLHIFIGLYRPTIPP